MNDITPNLKTDRELKLKTTPIFYWRCLATSCKLSQKMNMFISCCSYSAAPVQLWTPCCTVHAAAAAA